MNHEFGLLFYTVAALFIFGIPAILRKQLIPVNLNIQVIDPNTLSDKQKQAFEKCDRELDALGYRPVTTYSIPDLPGENLNRLYLSSADPARCTASFICDEKKISHHSFLEFITHYQDGTLLSTRNVPLKSLFDAPPQFTIQDFAPATQAAALKARHDSKAAGFMDRGVLYPDRKQLFAPSHRAYREFWDYQVARKLVRLDPATNFYRATVWSALRGIVNFLNPFVEHFSWVRFVAGLFAAAGLPAFVALQAPVLSERLSVLTGFPAFESWLAIILSGYIVAGITVGLLFSMKSFIWALVLGLATSNFAGPTIGPVCSMLMALTADRAARYRAKRNRIL